MSKINLKNLFVIGIVSFVLISANIGGLYIYALDEAKNSSCAREMMERGEWIVPTFNYELRTDKPPLHYYFMIASYSIFGVNAFSARFFSVIMGVMTVLCTWYLSFRYYGNRTALYAALVLLSSLHFVLQFHMAVPDPYLVFLLTLGFAAFYVFYSEKKSGWLLLAYVSFGLGFLAKGPVAIALPGVAILLFLIFTRSFSRRYFFDLKPLWILAVLILIVAPWFIMVGIRTDGEWLMDFFLRHNIGRYTETMEGHGSIFLATPLMVFLGLLPFTIFFPQAYRYGWIRRKEEHLLLYAGIVSLTFIAFFSFSKTKLPNYTVPAYPFIAILIGRYMGVLQDTFQKYRVATGLSLWIYLMITIALPVGLYAVLTYDPVMASFRDLAFFFLILPLGALLALILHNKSRFKGMVLSLSLSWIIAALLFFYIIFPPIDRVNPVAKLLPLMDTSKPVAAYKIYNSAFSFYLKKPVPTFDDAAQLEDYLDDHDSGYILTRKSFSGDFNGIDGIEVLGEAKDIFDIPTTIVYEIRKE